MEAWTEDCTRGLVSCLHCQLQFLAYRGKGLFEHRVVSFTAVTGADSALPGHCQGLLLLVLVEMFKAHLVSMIQRKSANPYARETKKGPRPGGAVKAPAFSSQLHLNSDCYTQPRATSIASTLIPTAYKRRQENLVGSETSTGSTQQP